MKLKDVPTVSVIIPVYNAENYLEQCLDSVVNQTLKDIEIICVNDGIYWQFFKYIGGIPTKRR